jgi:hypothetical protein
MSEHFFGVGRGAVSDELRERIDAIAEEHGATFVNPTLPGEGPRYWFACRNRGFPFDRDTERAVYASLDAAGIVLPGGGT